MTTPSDVRTQVVTVCATCSRREAETTHATLHTIAALERNRELTRVNRDLMAENAKLRLRLRAADRATA